MKEKETADKISSILSSVFAQYVASTICSHIRLASLI